MSSGKFTQMALQSGFCEFDSRERAGADDAGVKSIVVIFSFQDVIPRFFITLRVWSRTNMLL